MADKDFYSVLGVSRTASQDEIKRAYRKLARKFHPDVNPGDKSAERQFKEVQQAYDVIGDAEKRKKYDQFGTSAFEPGAAGPGGRSWSFRWGGRPEQWGQFEGADAGGFDFSKIFGDFASAEAFNASRGARESAARGARNSGDRDIEQQVEIPFLVAARGGEIQLAIERERPCPRCRGS